MSLLREANNRDELLEKSLKYFGEQKILDYPTFKGKLEQQTVKEPTKDPMNTPSVFVYTRPGNIFQKTGRKYNIYIYKPIGEKYISAKSFRNSKSSSDEWIYAETLSATIDAAAEHLGTATKTFQDIIFCNELTQRDVIERGLPICPDDDILYIYTNTVNITGAGFLFELEEAIYRMAASRLCFYGNNMNSKDKNYFSKVLGHITDPVLNAKIKNEILTCANGRYCFLEDLGVAYFKNKQYLEELYPDYIRVFDCLNELVKKLDLSYREPSLYFSDKKLEGIENYTPPLIIPPTPAAMGPQKSTHTPISSYDSQREFINQMRANYVEFRYTPDYVLKQIYNFGYTTPDMMSYKALEKFCDNSNINFDGTFK